MTRAMQDTGRFSEQYGRIRSMSSGAREDAGPVSEQAVQWIWYDQLLIAEALATCEGHSLRVLSPGWWNREEGPDFRGAQIEFNGRLRTGDVEVHLTHAAWHQHGHHLDPNYDEVILAIVLEKSPPASPPLTSRGQSIPTLLLPLFLEEGILENARNAAGDELPEDTEWASGQCAGLAEAYGAGHLIRFLALAGEWRILNKSRAIRMRADRVGIGQAAYEAFMTACGFSRYKQQFRAIAQQLPYDRARQLANQDPLLLETAFLQLAGLLPRALPDGAEAVPHLERLLALQRASLPGLRMLPLVWNRTGARPCNYPERRLAGAARFVAKTARDGLAETLNPIWHMEMPPLKRRRAFKALFPVSMGFWANHYSWTAKALAKPAAMIGSDRIRSIIGNVFVPVALAEARNALDRALEERVLDFFAALPKESGNHVINRMVPRLFGDINPGRIDFRLQQGLIQVYQDWCEINPSCHNCGLIPFLDTGYAGKNREA